MSADRQMEEQMRGICEADANQPQTGKKLTCAVWMGLITSCYTEAHQLRKGKYRDSTSLGELRVLNS